MSEVASLEERIRLLEEQVAALADRFEEEYPEIPWHVIAVAVAAVLPNGRILAATALPDPATAPAMHQNLWTVGGRLELLRSHRLR